MNPLASLIFFAIRRHALVADGPPGSSRAKPETGCNPITLSTFAYSRSRFVARQGHSLFEDGPPCMGRSLFADGPPCMVRSLFADGLTRLPMLGEFPTSLVGAAAFFRTRVWKPED